MRSRDPDQPHHLVQQGAVLQHQQVRVENTSLRSAHALADPALDIQELMPRGDQRFL